MIGEPLRQCFSIAPPLTKTASSSILPYQFEPDSDAENIEEDRAETFHARILQDILERQRYFIFFG